VLLEYSPKWHDMASFRAALEGERKCHMKRKSNSNSASRPFASPVGPPNPYPRPSAGFYRPLANPAHHLGRFSSALPQSGRGPRQSAGTLTLRVSRPSASARRPSSSVARPALPPALTVCRPFGPLSYPEPPRDGGPVQYAGSAHPTSSSAPVNDSPRASARVKNRTR
jgi:hypothetical protein